MNIINNAGANVTATKNQDGSLDVIIAAVEKKIAGGIASGASPVDSALRGAYGMRRG